MDVLLIGVRGNDKSVPPLCPAHSQLIADTVRLLRGDLARIEGLSYLIAQHIIFFLLFPARHSGIAGLCQRVYSPEGLSCTLAANPGGFGGKTGLYEVGVPIKCATKTGYQMAQVGDSIDLSYATVNSRRGRVGKEIAHTTLCRALPPAK